MTIWDEAAEAVVDSTCDTTAPGTVLYGPADLGSVAGIDVIGDFLTEVNVTCPTCIRELDTQFSLDIAGMLMDTISSRLSGHGQ